MKQAGMKQELAQLGNGAHALAIQILGNREDAADAVHDAFAAVLGKADAYDRDRGPLKPWFLRVVRNRCIDRLRQRRPSGVDVEALADPTARPDELAEAGERDRQLRAALARRRGSRSQGSPDTRTRLAGSRRCKRLCDRPARRQRRRH